MSYDLAFYPPRPGLDPRDDRTIAAWLEDPPTRPALSRRQLNELACDVAARLDADLTLDDEGATIVVERHAFLLVLQATTGWYEGSASGLDAAWPALEELCERAGWVVHDPQRGEIVLGLDLLCRGCGSAIAPTTKSCGVCSALVTKAHLPLDEERSALGPWHERALASLEARKLIAVRPVNRSAVREILQQITDTFFEDPPGATEWVMRRLENSPAVDELFGEQDELLAALTAAGGQ